MNVNPEWLWTIFIAITLGVHIVTFIESVQDRNYLVVRNIDSIYKNAAWKMVRLLFIGTCIRLAFFVAGVLALVRPGHEEWDLYSIVFVGTSFLMAVNSILDRKDSISIRAKTRSRARKGE